MYDEMLIKPMREELTSVGLSEARTADEVTSAIEKDGTVLVVVNSVCGCAAANARPAIRLAAEYPVQPDRKITVFAGNDKEATAKARSYFLGFRPSSPSIALIKDGQVVKMIERHQIEGREAHDIASELTQAFEQYCATPARV